MLPGTEQTIYNAPELLAVAHAVRDFRTELRAVKSKDFAVEWTDRIGRVVDHGADREHRFNRLAPLAGFVASARVLPLLDVVLDAQNAARDAGHSERWIRKALKHPESRP